MTTHACKGKEYSKRTEDRVLRMAPIARAIAITLAAGGVIGHAQAQRAFSPAWFADKGSLQNTASQTGRLPNGMPASSLTNPALQQQQASAQLQRSISNLTVAAQAIAARQAAQAAARDAALKGPSPVPNGLADGGLKADTDSLTAGWHNANAPVQTLQADGGTNVAIQQTGDKAILNWETFNVGKRTTVEFQQQADWAVLNRVNDTQARPSQIQGQIKANGTVLIVNRNGIVFSGSSQTDTRNLVVAAANLSDAQFRDNGLYGRSVTSATFTGAGGAVKVEQGAQIVTREPQSVTNGGGYVMLLGTEVENAGEITTRKGQTQLAAGDSFRIRKGVGTDSNQFSTTRGSEIAPQFNAGSTAGKVGNTGLILAREGDITLAGRDVRQDGATISTTTVNTRGTIHLLNSASDTLGQVTLGKDAVTAVLIEDDGKTTALDSQRDALIKESATLDQQRLSAAVLAGATKNFDNYSTLSDRRDLSRIEIVGGGRVNFAGDSLTLATGGQLAVTASNSASLGQGTVHVNQGAQLDVSGAVGVQMAMESNNIKVNVQGNELRDAPLNRDAGKLFNRNLWVDRRRLTLVPAGTGGYESDRWYTAGGLLEVSGYLGNQGHGIGEWAAQGGIVNLTADNVVTQAGSRINLAGGTLDVATGYIQQTWLKGSDGNLYTAGQAPGDLVYSGVYVGYEDQHVRWGVTETYYNPLIAPQRRLENGYTVGRDAGKLEISAANATLDGDINAQVFNSGRQIDVRPATVADAYKLSQTQAAMAGRLLIQTYDPTLDPNSGSPRLRRIVDVSLNAAPPADDVQGNSVWLNLDRLNDAGLGGLSVVTLGNLGIGGGLTLAAGGALGIEANLITLGGDLSARGGSVRITGGTGPYGEIGDLTIADGITIDTRGLWTNAALDPSSAWGIAFRNGGAVSLNIAGALALESGSRIDASAGGAVLADGSTRGGNGGNISLSAGGLVIDGGGEIASYGFGKGGKLTINTPAAISIGGTLTQTSGQLAAGEAAPFDLTVSEDFTLPAGSTLPFELNVSSGAFLLLGEPVPPGVTLNISFRNPQIVGPNGWTPPMGGVFARDPVTGTQGYRSPGQLIPAGYQVIAINSDFPAGYVLPADAFTAPIPIYPKTTTYAAGTVLAADLRVRPGTLLTRGMTLPMAVQVLPVFDITDADAFFQQGFSAYNLSGAAGLIVQPGTRIDVAMPVYRYTGASLGTGAPQQTLAGDALAGAVELALPPLFAENPVKGTLKQRAGADLSLTGGIPGVALLGGVATPLSSGALIVGEGAAIRVDPGHSISLTSKGQIDVEGSLVAPGGSISVVNTRTIADVYSAHRTAFPNDSGYESDDPTDALSVWIGEHAVLDAAGRAYTALDIQGNPYGIVLDGGSVLLGGAGGNDPGAIGGVLSTAAYVVVRPGALIDVSGASASLSLGDGNGGRVLRDIASDGGAISVNSFLSFFLAGEMRAQAGGAGAAGGSLALVLESPPYAGVRDGSTRPGRVLYVTQDYVPGALADDLKPGELDDGFVPAQARISAEQIEQGGFDSLSLWGRSAIAFDGDVNLSLGRSLSLQQGFLQQTQAGANVILSAPYVLFDGGTLLRGYYNGEPWPAPTRLPAFANGGTLKVESGLMDLRNVVRSNYDQTLLQSSGDLRFLASTMPAPDAGLGASGTGITELRTFGDLELNAAQIYPASGVVAYVQVGGRTNTTHGEPSRLSILSTSAGDDLPAQPYSLFGSLTLSAGIIEQGGVLRAPFGQLALNGRQKVELLPGSITSISTRDLVTPFGGTVDGVTYTYNGAAAPAPDLISGDWTSSFTVGAPTVYGNTGLAITSPSLVSAAGSLLDVSGGGQFVGGAFITGRGGSVDNLLNPRNAGGKVYALVPGAQPGVAPVAGGYYNAWTGAVPTIGQQITIADGAPGLPAGTYTLMPANYALLPGAWRVELGGQTSNFAGALRQPDGSWVTSGVQGIANTNIRDSLGTRVTLTDGATLRTWSTYNGQTYDQFQLAQATTFGTLRPMLASDGKSLRFNALIAADSPASSALVFNGSADFSAAKGGLPGSFTLAGATGISAYVHVTNLIITAPGSNTSNDALTVTVSGAELGKVDAPNLYVGGRPSKGYDAPNIGLSGANWADAMLDNLVVESGVSLTGGQVVLGANKKITMQEGASINTLGQGVTWMDSSAGLLFGSAPSIDGSYAALLVSNGRFTLDAPSGLFGTNIELQDGVSLYSEGSVGFYSDLGVSLTGKPQIGTRNLSLAVPSFNIGSDTALAAAGTLPAGMNLNQGILDTLFAGNPVLGAPTVESLSLTATQSINFFGSVDLNTLNPATGKSRLAQFVLNSPAIYGYGSAGDVVRLTADTLVWNDTLRAVSRQDVFETRYVSAPPGAPLASGLGSGSLQIDANTIVIGNPTPSKPDTTIPYNRLMLGFSEVNFNAAERITGNAKGSISVYQTGADPSVKFDPATYVGTGGNLRLNTPLLTGAAGSVISYYVGGALDVTAPAGRTAAVTQDIGAELNLHANTIDIASAVVLPSGKLTLSADQGVTLAQGSLLDVSGLRLSFFNVTRDTWGGDIRISSEHGSIVQQAGSTIDVSAEHQDAGTLRLSALDAANGAVLLGGSLLGSGANGYNGGGIDVRAQRIGGSAASLSTDFAALNAALNGAGFFGARAFDLRQGDLAIGDELKAHDVAVSVDGGSLTVNGKIDASGERAGSIRLAARDDVRLTGSAVLDAHGSKLQVDGYGQAIEAKNRGNIELTSAQGWLRLGDGITLDVSAPGVDYGRVTLNARRASETGGDILINAAGRVNVRGAKRVAVNGFWTYSPTDIDGSIVQDNGGTTPVAGDGRLGFDQIDARNQVFYANALANSALQARLAGLKAQGSAYHLRPGVEIVSTDASNGKLTFKGDLNLAGYRYGPNAGRDPASASYGAGEPLALTVRAAGDLDIKGSITDGFGLPKASPDDAPILLSAGQTLTADFTLPDSATLGAGTKLGAGVILPVNVELQGAEVLREGQAAMVDITLHPTTRDEYGSLIYGFGGTNASGELLTPVTVVAGQVDDFYYNGASFYPGDTIYYPLGDNAVIYAGTILSSAVPGYADVKLKDGAKVVANRALPQEVKLSGDYTLAAALTATGTITTMTQTYTAGMTIPAGTVLPSGTAVGTGAALPFDFYIEGTTWQAGNPLVLAGGYTLATGLNVPAGTVLPAGSTVASTVYSSATRPVWAVAPMLAAGSESASIRLVGGADLSGADTRTLLSTAALHGAGNLTLNDPRIDNTAKLPIFSVLRTGTGDLDILAGGNFSQASPFGVYTAGTQLDLPSGNEAFTPARPPLISGGSSITGIADYDAALNARTTWFPDHGGDLLIAVQGDLTGNVWSNDGGTGGANNYDVPAWLWHQGAAEMGHPPAWSINFGTFVSAGGRYNESTSKLDPVVRVAGFTGFGALGGGNATLRVDGDAGLLQTYNQYMQSGQTLQTSTGLIVAVGATGRVTQVTTTRDGAVTGGTLVQTGGGDLTLKIGGGLNAVQASLSNASAMMGTLTNLRGDMNVSAGAIGGLSLGYGTKAAQDPRGVDVYTAQRVNQYQSGPIVVPGDGAVNFQSRGDLVMSEFQDAPMLLPPVRQSSLRWVYSFYGSLLDYPGKAGGVDYNWFSLWTPATAISLFSTGGNLVPFVGGYGSKQYLPAQFEAVAGSGSIYYGSESSNQPATIELLPSATGQLQLLAMDSIYATARASGLTLGMSGAQAGLNDLPNPFKPAWTLLPPGYSSGASGVIIDPNCLCGTNTLLTISPPAFDGEPSTYTSSVGYFAFQGPDTPTDVLHAGDLEPIRFYAVNGDIVGAVLGRIAGGDGTPVTYMVAKAMQVHAGQDIVGFGLLGAPGASGNTGSYLMNANATDVSTLEAGGDIFYANVKIAGPGTLEVTAGGNLYQGNNGSLVSIGPVIPGDTRPGADIVAQVGFGTAGADYATLARLYLDPANQANLELPLAEQSGKVAYTYDEELAAWLRERYGFDAADASAARSYFDGLAPEQQRIFLRTVYYAELRAGGREYNDPDSRRFNSYLRGRQMIAMLFPETDAQGNAIARGGDLIQFGASGIQTQFGGDILALVPAGQIIIGVQGEAPPATSGLITQGAGDIQLYSQGSILLGLSRIMTTFGGDILAWSAEGDINAGRGSKTTLVYTPPKRTYDQWGNVKLSPQVPSTGAGIATLNPIPEIPPGDVDLIAPLGTIDAGEAGIRVSGNVNLAALHVVNAENIQVQGEAMGIPTVAAVNVAALTNASAAASSAATAAQDVLQRERASARQSLPSIFTVRVLGFGSESLDPSDKSETSPSSGNSSKPVNYDASKLLQLVGNGKQFDPKLMARLTSEERRALQGR
ncbi:filamentous haemagglutinin family protein [Variovorax sp. LT1R16]|uniref:filamentous haemagglutinin family protein n=1 Tax=Variovorax sp. LT1R16 TaxID=3443728 RepID=UPI003F45E03F